MIDTQLTGHMNYHSQYASADDCGSCDGARCDNCREIFFVLGERFDTLDEAEASERQIIELIGADFEPTGYTITDGVLYAQVYDNGHVFKACNPAANLYKITFDDTQKRMGMFNECTYADKPDASCANSCDVFKACNDMRCRREMKSIEIL